MCFSCGSEKVDNFAIVLDHLIWNQPSMLSRLASMSDPFRAALALSTRADLLEQIPHAQFPVTIQFDVVMSEFYKTRQQQRKMAKDVKFQESLLQGLEKLQSFKNF